MDSKEHNKLIGIFLLIHGGLQGLVMLLLAVIYGIIGAGIYSTARRQEDQMVGMLFVVVIAFVVIFSLMFIIPQVIGGWKMLKERPNGRIWGIIGSIVACLSFPLGTAAGVYGLWFLFGEEGKRFYLGGNNYAPQMIQPPPNNWR